MPRWPSKRQTLRRRAVLLTRSRLWLFRTSRAGSASTGTGLDKGVMMACSCCALRSLGWLLDPGIGATKLNRRSFAFAEDARFESIVYVQRTLLLIPHAPCCADALKRRAVLLLCAAHGSTILQPQVLSGPLVSSRSALRARLRLNHCASGENNLEQQ